LTKKSNKKSLEIDPFDFQKHCVRVYAVVIEIIQTPLQIRFIGRIYRLPAVCNKEIKQK